MAAVRKAHVHREHGGRLNFIQDCAACAALDRLTARLQEAERERDEARTERNGWDSDAMSLAAQLAGFKSLYEECRAVLAAAEAREAALREALEDIADRYDEGDNYEADMARAALATTDPEASE